MTRCPECPGVNACIEGDGPVPCKVLFIGEAGGKDENRLGRVFIGKTGQEVNQHYLPLAGLRRPMVRITNAIKCMPATTSGKLDPNREKDLNLLCSCTNHHLYPEITACKPQLIVPMGAFACRALDPEISLELQHGIPLKTSWGMVFPMYHPAGGIHEPKKMLQIRTDWVRLGKYLKGELKVPNDDVLIHYEELKCAEDVHFVLANKRDQPLACDTESYRNGDPFCLTLSVTPGTGYLIRADNRECLTALQYELDRWTGPILWHNWLYDVHVVTAMGLRFPNRLIHDTMLIAFHLGNLPQGLKALAYRELGMVMQDFDDVVTPHSRPLVLDYYRRAREHDWPKPEEQLVCDEDGKWKLYRPQSMSTKLKRFFTDLSKNPNKDPFEMWTRNWEESQEQIEEKCGPWPGKCISHVPFEKALYYACRDADALLRLWPILRNMRRRVRKFNQERWNDATHNRVA